MLDIRLTARCYPTEERDKVVAAMKSLFPDAVAEGDDPVIARSGSVETFAEQLARQRIRAAARKVLLGGVSGEETRFRLNKQVAVLGKVSFSEEEHALGDIEVVMSAEDISAVIDAVAPRPVKEDAA